MSSRTESTAPVIAIVGSQGAYGRWLRRFFAEHMGLTVIGRDPAGDTALSERELIEAADVLIFSAPIRHTPSLIGDYVKIAAGTERGQLWLDLTSVKAAPVAALLQSQAEVVGLHPMCAPPKIFSLRGRSMVVCPARLDRWRPWLEAFLQATEAHCIEIDPEQHDRSMALIQGLTHAGHLVQAAVLRELAPSLGGIEAIAELSTIGYELDLAVVKRILHGNPDIYTDIQFDNPHVAQMLQHLQRHVTTLAERVGRGGEDDRQQVRRELLLDNTAAFGADALREGSYAFERLGYLLADLADPRYLSVFLPEDRPGSLRALLSAFEQCEVNLTSLHSSRNPDGEVHFRLGVDRHCPNQRLLAVAEAIEQAGIGRVVDRKGMV